MFSHFLDQKEQKGKWQKFGSHTWCYKPYPNVYPIGSTLKTPFGIFHFLVSSCLLSPVSSYLIMLAWLKEATTQFATPCTFCPLHEDVGKEVHIDFTHDSQFTRLLFPRRLLAGTLKMIKSPLKFPKQHTIISDYYQELFTSPHPDTIQSNPIHPIPIHLQLTVRHPSKTALF